MKYYEAWSAIFEEADIQHHIVFTRADTYVTVASNIIIQKDDDTRCNFDAIQVLRDRNSKTSHWNVTEIITTSQL